jgi:hypothetical protein
MSGGAQKSENIDIAILLGAQDYPQYKSLDNPAFGFSNSSVLSYLQDGLQLRAEQILNLFDDPSNVIDLDERISSFLSRHLSCKNIFLFYVGHGGFLTDREYYLAIRSTRQGREHTTGLRIKVLAETLNQFIGDKNLFLILDCCFAGEAMKTFQSTEITALVESKTFDALPEAGTALLVAASKDEPAISPADKKYTMFSESFLKALAEGIPYKSEKLSLHDVAARTQEIIKRKYGQAGVRPEVHSPRQKGIDPAGLPIFPNRSAHWERTLRPHESPITVDPKLTELYQLDKIQNQFIVSPSLLTDDFVNVVSDSYFDIRKSLVFLEATNRPLRAMDPSAVLLHRGNLVLHLTPSAFWRSLLDEASLQGHRTLAIILCLIAPSMPEELRSITTEKISEVLSDYNDQQRRH